MTDKLVLSDMDDTLIHEEPRFRGRKEGLVGIPGDKCYVSRKAVELIHKIRERVSFSLVTGRRKHWIDVTEDLFHPRFAVIENGGVILENGLFNPEWQRVMEPVTGKFGDYNGPIWEYKKKLGGEGLKTRAEGRYTCFRVYMNESMHLTEEQMRFLERKVESEAAGIGLVAARSGRCIEVIPRAAGKEKAIRFLMDKYGFAAQNIMALGDGKNDKEMLELAGYAACPGNSTQGIKKVVSSNGGYVSNLRGHEGTLDLLNLALLWAGR